VSAPDAVTVYRTVGGEWRKTGNGAFTTHEYRALPAAQYAALVAERDALREALAGLVADILRRHPDDDYPALVNARTALGAERG
jgi:hypothetical protein